jgi:hypothetical protein
MLKADESPRQVERWIIIRLELDGSWETAHTPDLHSDTDKAAREAGELYDV